MNTILTLFLSLSLSGSILSLILLIIRPIVKNKLSQNWQYYIWLIVILRFLLPFTPQVSIVGETSKHFQSLINSSTDVQTNLNINIKQKSNLPTLLPKQNIQKTSSEPTPPNYKIDILNNIWILWLSISSLIFTHKVLKYRDFINFVKIGSKNITNSRILHIYNTELTKANINYSLPIYSNEQITSPMLIGIFCPRIVIPNLNISENDLRYIIKHELIHFKRLDFLYKWLIQITLCLHRFNPFIYLIDKEINRLCELSCDETLIKPLDTNSRINYGDTLVSTLKNPKIYNDFIISITMSSNINLIKERLIMIMNYKKKTKLITSITLLLTIFLLCGFTSVGAYTNNTNENPPTKISTKELNNYNQIIKTLDSVGIENINIDAKFCSLTFEVATDNNFEAVFSYSKNSNINYEEIFDLRLKKQGNNLNIFTEYTDNDFDDTDDFDDNLISSTNLLIKIPEKDYNKIKLKLNTVNSEPIDFNFNANTLEVISKTSNITFRTAKAFDNFYINHSTGNFNLILQELSKNINLETEIGEFTLWLPNNQKNLNLKLNSTYGSDYDFPKTWKYSTTGDTVIYENGNKQYNLNINNKKYSLFKVNLGDNQTIYPDINSTQYSKNSHLENTNGKNYFSYGRIDVADENGYAYQALVFICNGSDNYIKKFNQELEKLSLSYSNNQNQISGYLNLIRDNRLRNFGDKDFSDIKKVVLNTKDGTKHNAYVVAVCDSDDFMKSYKIFYKNIMNEYNPK